MISDSKLGLVFNPTCYNDWIRNSALTPTPILLNQNVIRVYCGFRDEEGISRIGYVDVSAKDPKSILKISDAPSLDIGRAGCFDDNGVILGDVVRRDHEIWMYYVGFQIVKKAKFLAFTGLAISNDEGETFVRSSEVPILDRIDGNAYIRAIHSVLNINGKWKVFYAQGGEWQIIKEKPFPKYNIWESETADGIKIDLSSLAVDCDKDVGEYRIGRPSAFIVHGREFLFYTKGSISGDDYFPGLAIKNSEKRWIRIDNEFPLGLSEKGWDSQHLCYPRLIEACGKYYLFYNGNNMGHDGFGVAEVTNWIACDLRNIALTIK